MPSPILILNGPNLNLLGQREPEVYGRQTLADIAAACADRAGELGLISDFRQSNHEGQLIDWIHGARETTAALIINPAGYTHSSVALRDALQAYDGIKIEVHLSNIHKREPFRHHSYVSGVVDGVICGLGATGYLLALDAVAAKLVPDHLKGQGHDGTK